MNVAELVAEHGSPLWLANLDVVRDRYRAFVEAWRAEWPDVLVAYSYKANQVPAVLRALAAEGAGHQVGSEAEYGLARAVGGAEGPDIVVHGPAKPDALLERAGADEALVVADTIGELRRARTSGVRRVGVRVSLAGVGHGASHFGVPMAEVPKAPRAAAMAGLRIEALAVHLVSAGFDRPLAQVPRLASALVVKWPPPPEQFAASARILASMAVRLGVPEIDMGGGFPPAPDELLYARAVTGGLGAAGFEGRLIVEPGRAIVNDAVELVCTVRAVKRLPDGKRCVVVDAGTSLLAGVLWKWARIEALGVDGPSIGPALVTGPLCTNVDVLHSAAELPAVEEGDVLLVRGVGAYHQTHATQFGGMRPAVVARDGGRWRLCSRRETLQDLLATDVGSDLAAVAPGRDGDGSANFPRPRAF